MRSFKCSIIISIENFQPSIPSMVLHIFLKLIFAAIQFCQALSFSLFQNTIYCETNSL